MPLTPKQQPPYYTRETLITSTTLTDAQIKALPTTPIQLIPPPGNGKMIRPILYEITVNTLAGAYTNISDGSLLLLTDTTQWLYFIISTTDPALSIDYLTDLIGGTNKRVIHGLCQYGAGSSNVIAALSGAIITEPVDYDDLNNANLEITIDNSGGNLTGGNPANTMKITIKYETITL